MSAAIIEFPLRPVSRARRRVRGEVLILPVLRIKRDDDFSIPPASTVQTLGQKLIAPAPGGSKERAAMPEFNVLAYSAGFVEGQLSGLVVPS